MCVCVCVRSLGCFVYPCIAPHKICVENSVLCMCMFCVCVCVCETTRGRSLDEQSAPAVCDGWTDTRRGGQRGSANTPSYRGGRGKLTRMSVTDFTATGLWSKVKVLPPTIKKKLSMQDNRLSPGPSCQQSFTGCFL